MGGAGTVCTPSPSLCMWQGKDRAIEVRKGGLAKEGSLTDSVGTLHAHTGPQHLHTQIDGVRTAELHVSLCFPYILVTVTLPAQAYDMRVDMLLPAICAARCKVPN